MEPVGLAVDADGAAWYTDPTEVLISRIVPSGEIKSFPLGTPIARLGRLAVAPDGAVWFAESTAYGFTRLKDGVLTRNVPKSVRGGPYGVAVDAKGNVWGTLQSGNQLIKNFARPGDCRIRNTDAWQFAERYRGRRIRQCLVRRISRQQDRKIR